MATINEDPTDKMLRDLKREGQRLKTMLSLGKIDPELLKSMMNGRPPTALGISGYLSKDDIWAAYIWLAVLILLALKEIKIKWEDELRAQIQENSREVQELEKWFEEKRRKANSTSSTNNAGTSSATSIASDVSVVVVDNTELERKTNPHLYNVNMDPLLTGRLVHILRNGVTVVGKSALEPNLIQIIGPG